MSVRQGVNTIAGSGYTKSEVDTLLAGKANTATTLAGYGITDGANRALSNITATGKEVCANMAMPSSRYVNLTFSHGQSYTAPADGYFLLGGYVPNATLANTGGIHNQSTGVGVMTVPSSISGSPSRWCLPVKKGEGVIMYLYGGTVTLCKFIYANGAQ